MLTTSRLTARNPCLTSPLTRPVGHYARLHPGLSHHAVFTSGPPVSYLLHGQLGCRAGEG